MMALINEDFVSVVDVHQHRPDWQNYRIYRAILSVHSENPAYDSAKPQKPSAPGIARSTKGKKTMSRLTSNVPGAFKLLLSILVISLLAYQSLSAQRFFKSPRWTDPRPPHSIAGKTDHLEILWSKSDVFMAPDNSILSPDFAAAEGMIFVMGSTSQTENYSLLALEATDGAVLWQIPGSRSSLYATPSALYVGSSVDISAYDLRTGEHLWIKRFLSGSARGVRYLYVENNLIFTRLGGYSDKYVMEIDTRKSVPVALFGPEYFDGNTVFNQQIMFIRPEPPDKEIRATARQRGKVLWQVDVGSNVVSNLAATEEAVYFLTENGKLLGLDALTGDVVASIHFEPSPFITFDLDAPPGGYYVAVDKNEGLLYALLGDSAQLFAFRIVGYSEKQDGIE